MAAEQIGKARAGSRFAATCGLLRQFMMEQQGANGGRCVAPAVSMGVVPGAEGVEVPEAPEERKTMELFPQQAGALKDSQERREPERAQLTIFYAGRAMVFDDFPAEKAKELMQLAGSCNSPAAPDASAAAVCQNAPGHPCFSDMPIARKASLQRFLEKRKNRLAAADPYPVAPAPAGAANEASKPVKDDGAPWLGVNSVLNLN